MEAIHAPLKSASCQAALAATNPAPNVPRRHAVLRPTVRGTVGFGGRSRPGRASSRPQGGSNSVARRTHAGARQALPERVRSAIRNQDRVAGHIVLLLSVHRAQGGAEIRRHVLEVPGSGIPAFACLSSPELVKYRSPRTGGLPKQGGAALNSPTNVTRAQRFRHVVRVSQKPTSQPLATNIS